MRCASCEDWRRIHKLSSSGRRLHALPRYLFSRLQHDQLNGCDCGANTFEHRPPRSVQGSVLVLEAELYRWMYDGYITECNKQQLAMLHNRSKCFSPVHRFQQFQLELSHRKLQAVAQDYIIRWQSICRAYTWSSLFGKQQMLLSDDAHINDLVPGKTATNSVCQDALQHEL